MNAFPSFKMNVLVMDILDRGIECLMPTTFGVIDIFANHFPIIKIENFLP
jgi:hypothetical protein